MTDTPLTYDHIKQLAKELRHPASTLYALCSKNDPFFITPARQEAGQWFKIEASDRLSPEGNVHLRRPHYFVISQALADRPQKRDGTAYENSEADWKDLCRASLTARELKLVDADDFVDRRAGDPTVVHIPHDENADAEVEITGRRQVPSTPPVITAAPTWATPVALGPHRRRRRHPDIPEFLRRVPAAVARPAATEEADLMPEVSLLLHVA